VDLDSNPFDVLYIDEDVLNDSTAPPETSIAAPSNRSPSLKVTYEMEDTDDAEIGFALYCFFNDLNRLREFLRHLWSDYQAGNVDLITASVTTNTAMELVQREEKEFFAMYPILGGHQLAEVLYDMICEMRGQDPGAREEEEDLINYKMLDVAEWLYMPPYSLLLAFCEDVIHDGHTPVIKPGYFGVYDPNADRSKLTDRQRMLEDKIILLESLPEFFVFAQVNDNLVVPDELTLGLHSVFAQKTVPLWVCYSAQIFLDINHVLRADVVRGLSELQSSGTHAASTLKKYFATSKISFENWPPQNEEGIKYIDIFIDRWIVHDALNLPKLKRQSTGDDLKPYLLFSRHPLLCGLFQFKLYSLLQESAILLADAWGSILYVAHLYEACRHGGYLRQSWPDMELIMDIHTRDRMFAGRSPQTAQESLKCMSLMLGISPIMFSPTARRPSRFKSSKKGPKGLTSNSPMMDVLRGRYVRNEDGTKLTLNAVEGLLRDREITSTSVSVTAASTAQSSLQRQWAKSHKLTVLQFLGTLRHAISVEEHMLRFDYLSLHFRCLRLLRALRTDLDDKLRQYFGPRYIEDDTHLALIIGHVFQVASESEKSGESIKSKDQVENLMLKQAGSTVDQFIKLQGEVECNKLEKLCVFWLRKKTFHADSGLKEIGK
jgi:hypothetical protein